MTGRRRKNRAIEKIFVQLSGKPDLHDENAKKGVLRDTPEIEHVSDTLTSGAAGEETGLYSWWSDDAFRPFIVRREVINDHVAVQQVEVPEAEFTWAKRRAEQRRQREAARRKREAA